MTTADKSSRYRASSRQRTDHRADCWLEADRIERYLPVLERQREEAARRLADLTDLIADEKAAIVELRGIAEPEKGRAEGRQAAA